MRSQKNILILLLDSLNFAHAAGHHKSALTPAFDHLCAEGMLFKRHHAVSSFTVPCVASMLTGLYPFGHNLHFQHDAELASNVVPIGVRFRQAGYRTLATVTEVLNDQQALLAGFDELDRRPDHEQGIHSGWGAKVTERLRQLRRDPSPWLYVVHSFDLHPQRQCAPEYRNRRWGANYYDQSLSSLDASIARILEAVDFDNTVVVLLGDHGENLLFEPANSEWLAHKAYRVRAGRTFEFFREWCFQNGLKSAKKFWLRNNPLMHHDYHLYNFLTHVPMVVVDRARVRPGSSCERLSSHIDLLPTLLDLAGIAYRQADFHGRSLLPLLGQQSDWQERPIYQEVYSGFVYRSRPAEKILHEALLLGVVSARMHLIWCPIHPEYLPELYDLRNDPDERRNLAAVLPEQVQKHREMLDALIAEIAGAPSPAGKLSRIGPL